MNLHQMVLGPLGTNCYIVWEQGEAVVIDPGYSGEKIAEWLISHNLNLNKILLTHSHFDHIGGLKSAKSKFPNAKVVIGATEAAKLTERRKGFPIPVNPDANTNLSADVAVKQGDVIQAGALSFTVLDTPGHTAGGVCYKIDRWIFSGDTLFYLEVGRTDLEGGNYDTLLQSLKILATQEGDYRVFPGHEQDTTLDFERKNNPYMIEAIRCVR